VSLDHQRTRPTAEAGLGMGKGKGVGNKERCVLFVRSETSCGLGCRRDSSHHSSIFCLIKRERERERRGLGYWVAV
jgi:hypothetical protein